MGIVSAKNAYNSSEVLRVDARKAKVNTHYDQVARSNDGDIAFVSKEGRDFIEAFPQKVVSIVRKLSTFEFYQSLKPATNFRERVINTYLKIQNLV